MRIVGHASAIALATLLSVGAAEAKGCIKGAIIGGIAGHYLAERGVVGAVAGCLTGRYLANRKARRNEIEYGSRVQPRDTGYGPSPAYPRRSYSY
jgi:outer membrane lipoprotein SlyB